MYKEDVGYRYRYIDIWTIQPWEGNPAICNNLEDVMLSLVSQSKTNTVWHCLYVGSEKKSLTHRNRVEK